MIVQVVRHDSVTPDWESWSKGEWLQVKAFVMTLGVLLFLGCFAVPTAAFGEGLNGFVIAGGLGVVLFWLLVRAFGVAFATRLNLAAAAARLQASQADR